MDLSIIILTFNTEKLVKKVLQTIFSDIDELTCTYEIIVIDNASRDKTVEMLTKEFPKVKLIANETNRGAAPARNQGILASSGQCLLFLDSDTFITSRAISTMLRVMESGAKYGAVGCKLFFPDGRLQTFACVFPTVWSEFFHALFFHKLVKGRVTERFFLYNWDHATQREMDWWTIACLLVRKDAIDSVGLLDEKCFYGAEDTDWCYRMRRKGWKVVFTPEATAIHVGGQSIKTVKAKIYDKPYKGKLLFFEKHYGKRILPVVKAIAILDALTNMVAWLGVYLLFPKKRERAKTFLVERSLLLKNIALGRMRAQ